MSGNDDLVQACLDKIRNYGHVSFYELEQVLEARGVDPNGSEMLEMTEYPNTFVWAGMSKAFCDVLAGLQKSGAVNMVSASFLSYLADGKCLQLPIAKRPSKKGYRKPHWLPVVFNAKASRKRVKA